LGYLFFHSRLGILETLLNFPTIVVFVVSLQIFTILIEVSLEIALSNDAFNVTKFQ